VAVASHLDPVSAGEGLMDDGAAPWPMGSGPGAAGVVWVA